MSFFRRVNRQPLLNSTAIDGKDDYSNAIEITGDYNGADTHDSIVRAATNKFQIVEDYVPPTVQSSGDKLSAVVSAVQYMISQGSLVKAPHILQEFEVKNYVRQPCWATCIFCTRTSSEFDEVPSEDDVMNYMRTIIEASGMGFDVSIAMLILVERFIAKTNVTLRSGNWKPLIVASTLVACKTWGDDEVYFTNAHISLAFGTTEFTLANINSFERHFLNLIQYDVSVSQSLYSQRYFSLTSKLSRRESKSGRWAAISRSDLSAHSSGDVSVFQSESEMESPGAAYVPPSVASS
eukprot:TRINITY_DN12632_c0_g1_i1.p1 TRINITY_DN12632_c0_g1~~TRINITY_DN12632_c0_g1_i1.p1  ORF type:complete len:294 (-),score=49.59 TRINITY_DN12632_c0_g1_i1:145-1026(-)